MSWPVWLLLLGAVAAGLAVTWPDIFGPAQDPPDSPAADTGAGTGGTKTFYREGVVSHPPSWSDALDEIRSLPEAERV